jgi:hypothetical protein
MVVNISHLKYIFLLLTKTLAKHGGVAELANTSVIHPRDPDSNFSIGRKYFFSVCLVFEFKPVGC